MTINQEPTLKSSERSQVELSIIVPVYNQERNVSLSLDRIIRVLDSTLLNYELIVVNDGSEDNTQKVLQEKAQQDKRIRIISYTRNKGKGQAVKIGILESQGSAVMFTDGDLDIGPDKIRDYIKELTNHDLVIASKRHPHSRVIASPSRKFLSRVFNILVQVGLGIRLKDTQSGLKAGHGNVLRTIFKAMLVKRYAFDVELLTIATILNLNIKEMPIEMSLNKRFKIRDITRMLIDLAAIAYRHRIKGWYQKQLAIEKIGR